MKTLLTKTAPVVPVTVNGKDRKQGGASAAKSRRFRPRGYVVILDMKAVMK
jgi:hypothetical protein